MTKVISFEKFSALRNAGLNEREIREAAAPQVHSASDDFSRAIVHRAAKGSSRGY